LVKKDGIFLAMKGMDGYNEESKAMNALNKLGVKRIAVKEANLSDGSLRINLIYQKVMNTPVAYPRNFAKIKKNPL
ncbi:MAG: 16S rRNA (guanine(527)-N(7))-methyltransferase RsmG, partial [Erysipelotrichaceae bacterium]|nr:16S rRNA (guanine(527)-N(7))-methyltransferase RsmG [Erysipelotrichaceae bacterium]